MIDTLHGYAGNIGTEYFHGVTDETPLYETLDGGKTLAPCRQSPRQTGQRHFVRSTSCVQNLSMLAFWIVAPLSMLVVVSAVLQTATFD